MHLLINMPEVSCHVWPHSYFFWVASHQTWCLGCKRGKAWPHLWHQSFGPCVTQSERLDVPTRLLLYSFDCMWRSIGWNVLKGVKPYTESYITTLLPDNLVILYVGKEAFDHVSPLLYP